MAVLLQGQSTLLLPGDLTDMSSISNLPSCRCTTEVTGQKVGWGKQWDSDANSVLQVEGIVLLLMNIPWHPESSPGYPGLQISKENSPSWGGSDCNATALEADDACVTNCAPKRTVLSITVLSSHHACLLLRKYKSLWMITAWPHTDNNEWVCSQQSGSRTGTDATTLSFWKMKQARR